MDRKVPVAQVIASEFGIGAALDIEGNCRFYDLVRLRKICKISSIPHQGKGTENTKWRLLPNPTLATTPDSFLGIIQTEENDHFNLDDLNKPDADAVEEKKAPPKKGQAVVIDEEEEEPITMHSEKDMLVDGKYSDVRENLKSLSDIERHATESLFVLQKSSMNIFRFEDVIFSVYPHMAMHRKRGSTIREVFQTIDPMEKKIGGFGGGMGGSDLGFIKTGHGTADSFTAGFASGGGKRAVE